MLFGSCCGMTAEVRENPGRSRFELDVGGQTVFARYPRREHAKSWGDHAAAAVALALSAGRKPEYCRRKASSSVPFSTAVRTSRKGCTVALFQRICCALVMRLATIALTALSTNAVEIGSPRRRRAA